MPGNHNRNRHKQIAILISGEIQESLKIDSLVTAKISFSLTSPPINSKVLQLQFLLLGRILSMRASIQKLQKNKQMLAMTIGILGHQIFHQIVMNT